MFRRKRYMVFVMMVTLVCIVLAGCSGTGDKPTETEATDKTEVTKSSLRPEGVPDDYPNKEIRFIHAFGPGSLEAYFRILADKIKDMEGWKHGFVVEHREGASGRIGWSAYAVAEPDGYTLGFAPVQC